MSLSSKTVKILTWHLALWGGREIDTNLFRCGSYEPAGHYVLWTSMVKTAIEPD
jgi:hypothetical protein